MKDSQSNAGIIAVVKSSSTGTLLLDTNAGEAEMLVNYERFNNVKFYIGRDINYKSHSHLNS